jgi:hypothetical protein
MATSQSIKSGAALSAKADAKSGFTVDPGPYEATVIEHIVGSRMGQLRVYIPEWGGTSERTGLNPGQPDTIEYPVVSYASPFYGTTYGTDSQTMPDGPATTGQSYGMWMVPPDVGCKVLVTFVAGDFNRGYWFACVYDSSSHHMVPGLGRAIGGPNQTLKSDNLSTYIGNNSNLPVTEFGLTKGAAIAANGLTDTPRRPHEYQSAALIRQGLDRDKIRGAISSSSMREAPSNVYGISTPGRKATAVDQITGESQKVIYRTGGHQFVMDDGAAGDDINKAGTDQLVRLRTSGGHQILMNDTEHVLYIASDTGNQWLEFSASGAINVYSRGGIHMRTEGPMDFHSDALISMQAPVIKMNGTVGVAITTNGSFSAQALTGASIKSDGPASLSSMTSASVSGLISASVSSLGWASVTGSILKLNCGLPLPSLPVMPTGTNSLQDTKLAGSIWTSVNLHSGTGSRTVGWV